MTADKTAKYTYKAGCISIGQQTMYGMIEKAAERYGIIV